MVTPNNQQENISIDAYRKINRLIYEHEQEESKKFIFQFNAYNGPSHSSHTTKRLLVISEIKDDNDTNVKQNSVNNQVFIDECCNLLKTLIFKFDHDKFKYTISARLGIVYFFGKMMNWNAPINFRDLKYFLYSFKPTGNVSKNALFSSSFNPNKSVQGISKFISNIEKIGYKLKSVNKTYDVKITKKRNESVTSILLDENFYVISISDDHSRIWNIDLLRDNTKSKHKLSGTYLDSYDFRLQLTKYNEESNFAILKDLGLCEHDKLLEWSEDGEHLIFHKKFNTNIQYLKETYSRVFELPSRKQASEFSSNFILKIEDVTEYTKAKRNKNLDNDNVYRKVIISKSNINCIFNYYNWFKNLSENSMNQSILDISNCMYQELIKLSDIASHCSNDEFNNTNNRSNTPWLSTVIKLPSHKKANNMNSFNYVIDGKMVNYEVLALIKRINYAHDYLDIFGINIECENLNDILNEDIYNEYCKMITCIIGVDHIKFDRYGQILENKANITFKTHDLISFALKKLNEATETLCDRNRRDIYLRRLRKNKAKNNFKQKN